MLPVSLAALVVLLSGILAPRWLRTQAPYVHAADLIPLALGFVGMVYGATLQSAPASTWSAFIDLGSFAVGTSLLVTNRVGTWPRRVGALILGIHAAQVLITNDNALFPIGD